MSKNQRLSNQITPCVVFILFINKNESNNSLKKEKKKRNEKKTPLNFSVVEPSLTIVLPLLMQSQ